MGLRSLHRNGVEWKVSLLGEQALLLSPLVSDEKLQSIHELSRALATNTPKGILDVVPAYEALSIIFDQKETSIQRILFETEKLPIDFSASETKVFEIPVCYELGLDWEELTSNVSLTKEEVIAKHTSGEYTVAMMGFIPGFVFLEGLNEELACPRKQSPRTKIPAGSVGIGGKQTGIYSLESPGGWNIIGRTPLTFFDVNQMPPSPLNPGDKIKFKAITEEEFSNASA